MYQLMIKLDRVSFQYISFIYLCVCDLRSGLKQTDLFTALLA